MPPALRVRGREVPLGDRPALMGIVNASPESFSDGGRLGTLHDRLALADSLVAAGATFIDVGGESGVTNAPAIEPGEEIERVLPLIERVAAAHPDVVVSVDTYKPAVAEAALAAGASVVNDVSGLRDHRLAEMCARFGAGLVLAHTSAPPKQRLQDPDRYDDVTGTVVSFLRERLAVALQAGVDPEATMLDPGPDFTKTPAQTIELLRGLDRVEALGRPLLLALSRKDFIGALTRRRPRERLAGTLAAVGFARRGPGRILRVHDVREVSDYLTVADALDGRLEAAPDLELAEELRREPPAVG